jgi:hypothetical protein
MENNLILTISDNYNFFHLSRFFLSLFKTSFKGKAVLYAGPNTGTSSIKKLRSIGVEVIQYKAAFPYIDTPHLANFKQLPEPIHIYNFRHFLYLDYILKHEEQFSKVLLTDVRDVVFQRDPFDFDMDNALYVAMESRSRKIADCQYNSAWIRNGYGKDVMLEMAPHIISCAGTTIGPMVRVKAYLEILLQEIMTLRDAYNCADQAVHNRLLQQGRIAPVIQLYNEDSPILTIGAEPDFTLDAAGFVLDGKGTRPAIVHQYDRHPSLIGAMDKLVYANELEKLYLKIKYKLIR